MRHFSFKAFAVVLVLAWHNALDGGAQHRVTLASSINNRFIMIAACVEIVAPKDGARYQLNDSFDVEFLIARMQPDLLFNLSLQISIIQMSAMRLSTQFLS